MGASFFMVKTFSENHSENVKSQFAGLSPNIRIALGNDTERNSLK